MFDSIRIWNWNCRGACCRRGYRVCIKAETHFGRGAAAFCSLKPKISRISIVISTLSLAAFFCGRGVGGPAPRAAAMCPKWQSLCIGNTIIWFVMDFIVPPMHLFVNNFEEQEIINFLIIPCMKWLNTCRVGCVKCWINSDTLVIIKMLWNWLI